MKEEYGTKFLLQPQLTKTSQDNNWIIISTYSLWPLIILFGFFIEKDSFMKNSNLGSSC